MCHVFITTKMSPILLQAETTSHVPFSILPAREQYRYFWQLEEVKTVFRKWQSQQTEIEKVKTSSLSSASNKSQSINGAALEMMACPLLVLWDVC